MKLNVDVIYQNLKTGMPVTVLGEFSSELSLLRPEFYLEPSDRFLSDHVYVCSADHLPENPVIESNTVLICLGDDSRLALFKDKCCILSLPESLNIFEVFNTVQEVFNRYEDWENRISSIARQSSSLQELLEASRGIFENPMLLNGADLNYLAYTDADYLRDHLGIRLDGHSFDEEIMAQFLSLHELATDIREPILLKLMGRSTLSVNLFDADEYLGCITVFGEYRELRSSDTDLCVFFSQILTQAIQRNPLITGDRSALKTAIRGLLEGRPADSGQRQIISRHNYKTTYVCTYFQPEGRRPSLPGGYIASVIEQTFPDSMAFEHSGCVSALLPAVRSDFSEQKRVMTDRLARFLDNTQMRCGLSQPFEDLYDAGYSFFQAASAYRLGRKPPEEGNLSFFEDHILRQLLEGALCGVPARFFYSEGMARLKAHDQNSQVSYVETLKAFLDRNLSVSRTSEALILHRSSLIDRLNRIVQMTGFDLHDPDTRLALQLILRAEEYCQEDGSPDSFFKGRGAG